MSRAKAMTLGEQAYNESLRQLDPGYVNPNLPQWPQHLTQGQLRHWHTAVGPSLRRTKPHYRRMRAGDLPAVEAGQLEIYYWGEVTQCGQYSGRSALPCSSLMIWSGCVAHMTIQHRKSYQPEDNQTAPGGTRHQTKETPT